jgi:hypothetical protein
MTVPLKIIGTVAVILILDMAFFPAIATGLLAYGLSCKVAN